MIKMKNNKIKILNIIAFLIVPIISSFISTYHIVSFFDLGNYKWMAILLAVAFEMGAIASAMSIVVLDKISKTAVWFMFFILIFFQILGNVYYTFDYITTSILNNPNYLDNAKTFLYYFYEFETVEDFRIFLSILIGSPIPLLSLAFLKTLVDYMLNGKEETKPLESLDVKAKEEIETVQTVEQEENENVEVIEETIEETVIYKDEEGMQNNTEESVEQMKKRIDIMEKELSKAYPNVYGKNFDKNKIRV